MNKVYCEGKESTLYECDHAGWEKQDCQHGPVYLTCKRSPFLNESRFDKSSMAVSYTYVLSDIASQNILLCT